MGGPDYPDFVALPDGIRFGYNTGGNAPSMRISSGHAISLLEVPHNGST